MALALVVSQCLFIDAYAYVIPKKLAPGSKIAVITPASALDNKKMDAGIQRLKNAGYEPVVYPNAYGRHYGSYPSTDSLRAADLMAAFTNPEIEAIMCSRGGYGTVRLLPYIDIEIIKQNPKWLIGYSDISNLHAVMHKAGIASIHGPMCGYIGDAKADTVSTNHLFEILSQGLPYSYEIAPNVFNKIGEAKGILVGGNLLTINGLSETEYDVLNPSEDEDCILFLEDVGEKIYAIERVLMRLEQSGALEKFKGLLFGEFTEYKGSPDFETMEDMIHYWLKQWGYYDKPGFPIVFGFPAGHGEINYPLVLNAPVTLIVSDEETKLQFE